MAGPSGTHEQLGSPASCVIASIIAQLAEHALRKRTVVGSIPTGGFSLQFVGNNFWAVWAQLWFPIACNSSFLHNLFGLESSSDPLARLLDGKARLGSRNGPGQTYSITSPLGLMDKASDF